MLLIGRRGYERFGTELRSLGYDPVALEPVAGLNRIVADHADTLICDLGGEFVTSHETAGSLQLEAYRITGRLRTSSDCPYGDYPTDVCFNALKVGDCLFGRLASLSDDIKHAAQELGLRLVNVKQGYARCSALPLGAAAVTADRGMLEALRGEGIITLLIPAGKIALDGCEYGFIGGASFFDEKRQRAVFFGSLPDEYSDELKRFCSRLGVEVVELAGRLTDVGGALVI